MLDEAVGDVDEANGAPEVICESQRARRSTDLELGSPTEGVRSLKTLACRSRAKDFISWLDADMTRYNI